LAHAVLGASGHAKPNAQVVVSGLVFVGGRLDELDQHAARILGMDEVDP
jgi:hypothetical protein